MSEQPPEQTQTIQPSKKRGAGLTAWVAIMIIVNVFAIILYAILAIGLANSGTILTSAIQVYTSLPLWGTMLFLILAIVNLVSTVALLKIKKWGYFAFIASNTILIILDLALGLSTSAVIGLLGFSFGVSLLAIGGLLGIGTLYLLMRSKGKTLK